MKYAKYETITITSDKNFEVPGPLVFMYKSGVPCPGSNCQVNGSRGRGPRHLLISFASLVCDVISLPVATTKLGGKTPRRSFKA